MWKNQYLHLLNERGHSAEWHFLKNANMQFQERDSHFEVIFDLLLWNLFWPSLRFLILFSWFSSINVMFDKYRIVKIRISQT